MPDVQSLLLGAVHLVGRCAAPPTAAEVQFDVVGTYRTHATTESLVYGSSLTLDVINPQYPGLPIAFCFLPRCYSLGNRKGQLSDPCLRLTN